MPRSYRLQHICACLEAAFNVVLHSQVHTITADRVVGAYTGQSERQLREAFAEAEEKAASGKPVVIFLDELDALCPRRSASRPHEARIAAQLLTLLDGAAALKGALGFATLFSARQHGSELIICVLLRPALPTLKPWTTCCRSGARNQTCGVKQVPHKRHATSFETIFHSRMDIVSSQLPVLGRRAGAVGGGRHEPAQRDRAGAAAPRPVGPRDPVHGSQQPGGFLEGIWP